MAGQTTRTTIGSLPNVGKSNTTTVPKVLTVLVWTLWAASVGALAVQWATGYTPELGVVVAIDELTVLMWVVVTTFSGIVHSYSRRYVAGNKRETLFFARIFGFTLAVMTLVAAAHLALFVAAWLVMGLLMADLIGHVENWPQAQAAATRARKCFIASTGLLVVAAGTLWWATGETTVAGVVAAAETVPTSIVLVASAALLLAAMIQSALLPFHSWMLSSMTAPTPASALMHAGFVNAGGILLARFAPVVTLDPLVMSAIVLVGASSALFGKLLKEVQPDVKRTLGSSTVGQMGFMILQAGLGFFGAAITHLILHGFYKAYLFLSSGSQIEHTSPEPASHIGSAGVVELVPTVLTGLAGGAVFALLTGKGLSFDSGLVLTLFVVLTTLHATRRTVRHTNLGVGLRYGAVPLVFLPAIAIYGLTYEAITRHLSGLPTVTAPTELTVVHGLVAATFILAYVAIETGFHRRSTRLYVTLLNLGRPASDTLLTDAEEYNEY